MNRHIHIARPTTSPALSAPSLAGTGGWAFRTVVVAITSVTLTLTLWAGAQGWAVQQRLERLDHAVPHTPVRQMDHAQQSHANLIKTAHRHDEHRFANQASLSTDDANWNRYLLELEFTELRRFRNIAPAGALPALDAEIGRLGQALSDDGSA